MARKKFTEFRDLRWNKLGLNEERAAAVLGVSVEQITIWDYEEPPVMAGRLLMAWDRKVVGQPGWDGWYFSRGVLQFKDQRFGPETILNARYRETVFSSIESDVKRVFSGLGYTGYQPVSIEPSHPLLAPPKKIWWK